MVLCAMVRDGRYCVVLCAMVRGDMVLCGVMCYGIGVTWYYMVLCAMVLG